MNATSPMAHLESPSLESNSSTRKALIVIPHLRHCSSPDVPSDTEAGFAESSLGLEEMCKANKYCDESLNALLLNHYLRLYDFLLTKQSTLDDGELKKVEVKIKLISPDIYELLKNNI